MRPDEFRRYGHEVVDWIADYLAGAREYPVFSRVSPGEIAGSLPASAPEQGEPMDVILEDFRRLILPGVTHWNHPRFLAYFAVTGSGPGILGEMLSAALNVNGMLWRTSPAVTELEQVTLGWLRQWLDLPEEFFGIIHDTASTSTLHAVAAAREAADPEARTRGGTGRLILYCSEQAHSSVERAVITLGIGRQNLRKIPVDDCFRLRPEALSAAVEEDLRSGARPFCVTATAGTTSTTSIDPVAEIAAIAEQYRLWLHVDGAYAGTAAVVPEFRHVLAGARRADSVVVNPHKWMFTPIDCSALYTRRPEVMRRAFSLVPEYLQGAEAPNLMEYGVPLGRRFRALKLWFVMRHYGREGVARILRNHVALAQEFAGWVRADERFEIAAPHPLSVVCFRLRASEQDNRRLLETVNSSGVAFLSNTVLHGRFTLRLAIGHMETSREDLGQVWDCVRTAAG